MPKIREIQVYSFSELSPAAQKKAIEKWQRLEHENLDSDRITEMFKERLEEKGLPSKDINWSLSSSQGDGVAFYGTLSTTKYVEKNNLKKKYQSIAGLFMDINASIEPVGGRRYSHANSMKLEMDVESSSSDLTPAQTKLLRELHDHIADDIKKTSREFEKDGYKEIEYMTSEENAKETIEANEYEYDVNGNQI